MLKKIIPSLILLIVNQNCYLSNGFPIDSSFGFIRGIPVTTFTIASQLSSAVSSAAGAVSEVAGALAELSATATDLASGKSDTAGANPLDTFSNLVNTLKKGDASSITKPGLAGDVLGDSASPSDAGNPIDKLNDFGADSLSKMSESVVDALNEADVA